MEYEVRIWVPEFVPEELAEDLIKSTLEAAGMEAVWIEEVG